MVLIVIIALIAVIGGCAYCTVKPVADLAVTVDEAIESIDEVIGGIDEALDEPKKKSTPTPAQPAQPANLVPDVTVSSVELSKAYSDDRIAAEYEYEGKLAEIIGKVIGKEKKAGLY